MICDFWLYDTFRRPGRRVQILVRDLDFCDAIKKFRHERQAVVLGPILRCTGLQHQGTLYFSHCPGIASTIRACLEVQIPPRLLFG